jgi:hypothetical protein
VTGPEERLRRALAAEVADVDGSPHALDDIRRRIRARRSGWRFWRPGWGLPVLAGAVATAAAAVLGLATCTPPHQRVEPPAASVSAALPPVPPSVAIPVYYLGRAGTRVVLYREYHATALASDSPAARTRAALGDMLRAGSAHDPDYATYWPATAGVRDVRVDRATVTVDLTGVADAAAADPAVAARSVDQLVYTATAASDTDRLRVLVDGRPITALWGTPLVSAVARRPAADVQAPVWLIAPAHGETYGHVVAVHVAGIVPDGAARLRVRDGAGAIVVDQSLTLSAAAPKVGEARLTVPLDPGRYTVEAYAIDGGGAEVSRDDHDVTIR